MSDFSNYAEGKIYDHVTGRVSWTMPAVAYLALFTAVSDAEAGVGTEVSTGGYARQAVAFGAATDGAGSNSAIETFGPLSGAGTGTRSSSRSATLTSRWPDGHYDAGWRDRGHEAAGRLPENGVPHQRRQHLVLRVRSGGQSRRWDARRGEHREWDRAHGRPRGLSAARRASRRALPEPDTGPLVRRVLAGCVRHALPRRGLCVQREHDADRAAVLCGPRTGNRLQRAGTLAGSGHGVHGESIHPRAISGSGRGRRRYGHHRHGRRPDHRTDVPHALGGRG